MSLDKAYIIGFSLKDKLKKVPKTKREMNVPDREKRFLTSQYFKTYLPHIQPDTRKVSEKAKEAVSMS